MKALFFPHTTAKTSPWWVEVFMIRPVHMTCPGLSHYWIRDIFELFRSHFISWYWIKDRFGLKPQVIQSVLCFFG